MPGGLTGHAEDVAHSTGDIGVECLSVRADSAAATSDTDGDYQPLITDANGRLHVLDANSADIKTAVEKIDDLVLTEDEAASGGEKGVQLLAVRQDDANTLASADGDFTPFTISDHGCLNVDANHFYEVDDLNATTGWSVLGNDTDNLATTTEHVHGTAALTFDKVDGAANTVFGGIQKTISSVDLDKHFHEGGGFILYPFYLSSLADVDYAFIRLGTDSSNYNEWQIDDDDLVAGWNNIRVPISRPADSVGNGWNSAAVTYVAVGAAFDAEDDTLADIRSDSIMVMSGQIVTADISGNISGTISPPNVNVTKWRNNLVDTGAGAVGSGVLRTTLASDDPAVALLATIDADTSKIPSLGSAAMAASAPTTIATDDVHFGAVGTGADVDGSVHGQLRSIAEAVEAMDDWDDGSDHCEVVDPYKPAVKEASAAGVIATSTAIAAHFELIAITLHLSAAGTTSENFTVTLNANDGSAYDTLLFSLDLSTDSVTDLVITPEEDGLPKLYEAGDELDIAWPNTESRTYGLRIVTRRV
jgi:hypothetical protein